MWAGTGERDGVHKDLIAYAEVPTAKPGQANENLERAKGFEPSTPTLATRAVNLSGSIRLHAKAR